MSNMVYEDYFIAVALFGAVCTCFSMYIRYSERKHKLDLQAEKQARQEEAELILTKTRMYTDRDIRTSMIEASTLANIENPQVPEDFSLESVVPFLAKNPELVKNLIDKLQTK